jgi:hypothetical protein
LVVLVASTTSCRRVAEPEPERDAGATVAAPPVASPPPRSTAGPRALCPLTIEPGVGLGPVRLGESLNALEDAGLVVTKLSGNQAELIVPGPQGPSVSLNVWTCAGKVTQAWIDDLAKAPDCVVRVGRAPPTGAREACVEIPAGECPQPDGRPEKQPSRRGRCL